jgi:hypothetical protein
MIAMTNTVVIRAGVWLLNGDGRLMVKIWISQNLFNLLRAPKIQVEQRKTRQG